MARLDLVQLTCTRPYAQEDRVVLSATGEEEVSNENVMSAGETWQPRLSVELSGEATIRLTLADGVTLGTVSAYAENTASGDSSRERFQQGSADYTLTYRVRPSEGVGSESSSSDREEGFSMAPDEENWVELRTPKMLVYHPIHNQPGKHDADRFTRVATRFVSEMRSWRQVEAEAVPVDNGEGDGGSRGDKARQIKEDLEGRRQRYEGLAEQDKLQAVVIACHGQPHQVQLGLSKQGDLTEQILQLIAAMSRDDVRIILYACSTGAPQGSRQGATQGARLSVAYRAYFDEQRPRIRKPVWPRVCYETARDYSPRQCLPHDTGRTDWGKTSFADHVRSRLYAMGKHQVTVFGHSQVADAATFPYVLRFHGGTEGGQWVVDPGAEGDSDAIKAFGQHIGPPGAGSPLSYRYPFMSSDEILQAIGQGSPQHAASPAAATPAAPAGS